MALLEEINDDCLWHIAHFLDPPSVHALLATCRVLRCALLGNQEASRRGLASKRFVKLLAHVTGTKDPASLQSHGLAGYASLMWVRMAVTEMERRLDRSSPLSAMAEWKVGPIINNSAVWIPGDLGLARFNDDVGCNKDREAMGLARVDDALACHAVVHARHATPWACARLWALAAIEGSIQDCERVWRCYKKHIDLAQQMLARPACLRADHHLGNMRQQFEDDGQDRGFNLCTAWWRPHFPHLHGDGNNPQEVATLGRDVYCDGLMWDPCVMMMLMASFVRRYISPTVEQCLDVVARDVATNFVLPVLFGPNDPTANLDSNPSNMEELCLDFARTACHMAASGGCLSPGFGGQQRSEASPERKKRRRLDEDAPAAKTLNDWKHMDMLAAMTLAARSARPSGALTNALRTMHAWTDRFARRLSSADHNTRLEPSDRLGLAAWSMRTCFGVYESLRETNRMAGLSACITVVCRAAMAYGLAVLDAPEKVKAEALADFHNAATRSTTQPYELWASILDTMCAIHDGVEDGPNVFASRLVSVYLMMTHEAMPGTPSLLSLLSVLAERDDDIDGLDGLYGAIERLEGIMDADSPSD
ncbi:hypothetical protein ml_478 [Mollivirus sibericum]|uniref:hypothetical protein n=1 Tax=Mollivirus sibericum TaxID=1678078 RepID=UPI0006B2E676|nr:hypothetical protein ml_478 [Mollivirus sibericum]ALD62280.1 hypothetical protein ml_478 [Mollivirus sibericum]